MYKLQELINIQFSNSKREGGGNIVGTGCSGKRIGKSDELEGRGPLSLQVQKYELNSNLVSVALLH